MFDVSLENIHHITSLQDVVKSFIFAHFTKRGCLLVCRVKSPAFALLTFPPPELNCQSIKFGILFSLQ